MTFLESKSLVQNHTESHFCLLKRLWFDLYPRGKGRNATSSGFEHVFLAESKKKKLIGFHNWVYFAAMERSGALNYKGWERIIDLGDVSFFSFCRVNFLRHAREISMADDLLGNSMDLPQPDF
jgi:hypothetical protein